jgi:DNA-binding transcriptional regulator YiaG
VIAEHEESLFVKKAELARSLGVSTRTVDTWVAKRMIPYLAVSPRLHLFNVKEVEGALRARFGVSAAK